MKRNKRLWAAICACVILCVDICGNGGTVYAAQNDITSIQSETESETESYNEETETSVAETESESEEVLEVETTTDTVEEPTTDVMSEETTVAETETATESMDSVWGESFNYQLSLTQLQEKDELADSLDMLNGVKEDVDYVKDEVIYMSDSMEDAKAVADELQGELLCFSNGVAEIELPEGHDVKEVLELAANTNVKLPAVYPNGIRQLDNIDAGAQDDDLIDVVQYVENDLFSLKTDQFNEMLDGTPVDPYMISGNSHYQYQHAVVGSEYAWKQGYMGQDVKVAVIDTGANQTADLEIAVGKNGEPSGVEEGDYTDIVGHGTHVAGIIGAKLDGYYGAGIAPEADIEAIRVNDSEKNLDDAAIIRALNVAGEDECDVVNMSLGGPLDNPALQEAIDELYNNGIVVVASSGNDGGYNYSYPACNNHVISVASTNSSNEPSSFTSKCDKVDVCGPGTDIWANGYGNDGEYVCKSGTSMACPVVVGEVAVILSSGRFDEYEGGKKVDQIESTLKKSAIKVGGGMGAGIPYLPKALGIDTDAVTPNAPAITYTTNYDEDGEPASLDVTITSSLITHIVYTQDGTKPSYSGGVVKGIQDDGCSVTINCPLDRDKVETRKISALCYTDAGMVSKVKTLAITVKPYVRAIILSGNNTVEVGKSIQLSAEVLPSFASNKKLSWKIVDAQGTEMTAKKDGISVSSSGKVTTVKSKSVIAKTGTYTVTATAIDRNKIFGTYTINVYDKNPVTGVEITGASEILMAGKSLSLKATVTPNNATNKKVIWFVGKENVVTGCLEPAEGISISSSGVVTTKAGIAPDVYVATATAADGSGISDRYDFVVGAGITSITPSVKNMVMEVRDEVASGRIYLKVVGKNIGALKVTQTGANIAKVDCDSRNWIVDEDNELVSIPVIATGAKLGKAVVTIASTDGSNKKATVNITVKQMVNSVSIEGSPSVIAGKSITLKANVLPSNATNKKVLWNLMYFDGVNDAKPGPGISISSSGVVKTKANVQTGTYRAIATALDGTLEYDIHEFKVTNGGISSITPATKNVELRLTGEPPVSGECDVTIEGTGDYSSGAVKITQTNDKIVSIDGFVFSDDKHATIKLKGRKPGKATITLAATDGSNKKATINVTVKQMVQDITVTGSGYYVVAGKKLTLKAAVSPSNATNKKVLWTVKDTSGNMMNAKDNGISISSSGVVTTTTNAAPGQYVAVATAQDGTLVEGTPTVAKEYMFEVRKGGITSLTSDVKNVTIYRTHGILPEIPTVAIFRVTIDGKTGFSSNAISVTQTGTNIATIDCNKKEDSNVLKVTVEATGNATGKVVVTVASNDGTGKKTQVTVNVVNPPSSLKITPPDDYYIMTPGSSKKMKAVIGKEYGKLSSTKVDWSIDRILSTDGKSYDKHVTISSNGTLKVDKSMLHKAMLRITVRAAMAGLDDISDTYEMLVVPNPMTTFGIVEEKNGKQIYKSVNSQSYTVRLRDYSDDDYDSIFVLPAYIEYGQAHNANSDVRPSIDKPSIVAAKAEQYVDDENNPTGYIQLWYKPLKTGNAKISYVDKITGKKFTVNLKIVK